MIDIVSSSDRTMTVGECCESIYSGGTPSTKKAAYWNGNLPWLSSGETRCRFIIDTEKTITELGVAKSSTKLAKAGDVVMASAGQGFTRGQTSMLFFDTYVNQSVVVMRPKRDYGAYLLLMLAAQYDNLRAWSDSTSTRGSMSGKLLRQFELPYFDVEQAKELTAFTAPMFAMIENNMRESKALAQTRDALLPKLMSGEIDVSEVELPKQPNSHLPVYRYCILQTVPIRIWKGTTMEAIINTVLAQMQPLLNGHQLKQLAITLRAAFEHDKQPPKEDPADLLALFLTAKEVEGCSPKTIAYYRTTLEHMTEAVAKPYTQVTSDDLRSYLSDYELKRGAGKVTVDNIRRIMSSFFSWLEDEDYVVKSPVRRIHRVKCAQATKEVLTDEQVESLRDGCTCTRDLAIIEMLASTGMRVGELVRLDIADVDLQERECVVMGKGNKQRPVYFDVRTKLRINEYLALRHDDSPALFVSLRGVAKRMTVGNVEARIRELGKTTSVGRVHPHKFRRTLATRAIDKGMPIEQVQKLLGHAKIDTTMRYAMVNQNNVKASHRKYLE